MCCAELALFPVRHETTTETDGLHRTAHRCVRVGTGVGVVHPAFLAARNRKSRTLQGMNS